jgi:GNAT superfamily N-acetyltransferase
MRPIELKAYQLENPEDVAEIVSILTEYYPKSPFPATAEQVRAGDVNYLRAFHSGKQIGISGYVIKTPRLAETVKTTIFHEFRGQGLGADLSFEIEEECRRRGIKKVMTTIYYFNHVMVHIKLKQGYTIEGYHPDHEAPGFHEYSLGKVLR